MSDTTLITMFNERGVDKQAYVDNRPPEINFATWICDQINNLEFKDGGKIVQTEMMYCINEKTRVPTIVEITSGGVCYARHITVRTHQTDTTLIPLNEWIK